MSKELVTFKAAPSLNGVSFHEDIGFTVEQYQELKYGSGETEIPLVAAEWLERYGHGQIIKGE